MTKHEQFCQWLSGYLCALEESDPTRRELKRIERIREELAKATSEPVQLPIPVGPIPRAPDQFAPPFTLYAGGIAHASDLTGSVVSTDQVVSRDAFDRQQRQKEPGDNTYTQQELYDAYHAGNDREGSIPLDASRGART